MTSGFRPLRSRKHGLRCAGEGGGILLCRAGAEDGVGEFAAFCAVCFGGEELAEGGDGFAVGFDEFVVVQGADGWHVDPLGWTWAWGWCG